MKTNIVNKTNLSFELKEGNAGAYRFLKMLASGAKVSIRVDPNATYREYVVATGKKGESIFLTSDDFSEYKVIDIVETREQDSETVIYKSVPSHPRRPGSSKASAPPTVEGAGAGSVPAISAAAGAGSVPAVSSAAAGVGSVPAVSSAAGAGSVPGALSVASSEPPIGISKQKEGVSWFKKMKSWFR